jgi:flagellar protein FliO/FliZ
MAPGAPAESVGSGYGELLVGSLLVLGLVCLVAWLVVRVGTRRLWGARGGGVLDVVARVPLEPRRSLYVVEVAGKTLLVGTSEMGLSVLSELDAERVRADLERPSPRSFADALRSVLRRGGGPGPGSG